MRKCTKAEKLNPLIALTRRSIRSGLVDRFVGTRDLKRLLHVVFSTILLHFFRAFHISDSKDQFKQSLDRLKAFDWIFWRIGGQGFGFGRYFLPPACHNQGFLISRAPRVLVVSVFLSTSLVSFIFVFLMAHRRELATLGHRASAQLWGLSSLSWRLVERRGLALQFSALWRTTNGTSKSLLREKQFQGEVSIFQTPAFQI